MIRAVLVAGLGAVVFWSLPHIPADAEERFDTSAGAVQVTRMAEGFETPWAFDFLPDGGMVVTEKRGRLLHIGADGGRQSVSGLPEIAVRGQGGLLDVTVARDFAETRTLFLAFSERAPGGLRTAAVSARLSEDGTSLEDVRHIFRQEPAASGGRHFGSRIVEAPDGTLFVTTGDRGLRDPAQDPESHIGKLIRVARDGSVPADNPFVDGGALPEIWSLGHRNIQGATLDLEGRIVTVEHGARGGDEVNIPEKGENHGWPVISYGTHYSGAPIGEGQRKAGLEQPRAYWDPSIAPSGAAVHSGRLFPEWEGDLFTGSLKYDHLARVDRTTLAEGAANAWDSDERLFEGDYSRIRDVLEGPDGAIWFLSVGDGALYRVTPGLAPPCPAGPGAAFRGP